MISPFRSALGRRIFLLFIVCALLPIAILAALSLTTFTTEITEKTHRELQRSCKAAGLEIFDNLLVLESRLNVFALNPGSADRGGALAAESSFHRVGFLDASGGHEEGGGWPSVEITAKKEAHLRSGRSILFVEDDRIYMMQRAPSGIVIADLRKERIREGHREIYLFAADGSVLSEKPAPFTIPQTRGDISSQFGFEDEGQRYLAASWSIFLEGQFMSPPWNVVVARDRAEFLRPIRMLKTVYALVVLLTFLIVTLLSIFLIRRSLAPINTLREGTERIAAGDFQARIAIESGDEFEDLGGSFNAMSENLQEMQSLLIHGERIKTIGQMSAAIVHEINQPLQAIMAYLEVLRRRDDLPDDAQEQIASLTKTVDRLGHISQRFKRFARGSQDVEHAPLSVNSLLASVEELLGHQLQNQRCTLSLRLQEGLPLVVGDGGGLQQVFLNLIMNAMEAMEEPQSPAGAERKAEITVTTSGGNGKVTLLFEDTGPGIPEEVREQIFEPFFSTKKEGKGSGLGLAIAREILRHHNGTIEYSGLDGRGSRFTVVLPAAPPGTLAEEEIG